jgi:hypothetical protein
MYQFLKPGGIRTHGGREDHGRQGSNFLQLDSAVIYEQKFDEV